MPDTMSGEPPPTSAGGPPTDRGWYTRGRLPHYDAAGTAQLVTYRLADALPREAIVRCASEAKNEADRRKRIEAYLDAGHGACALRRPAIAELVVANWQHFARQRYELHAWVVMLNHVHVLITPRAALAVIVHGWKSYTAKHIARLTRAKGRVWQPEYWDRAIRDERHYRAAVRYVHRNPVTAGLVNRDEDWPWSSARAWLRGHPPDAR